MRRLCWGCEKGFGQNGRFVLAFAFDLFSLWSFVDRAVFLPTHTQTIEMAKHFGWALLGCQS